MVEHERQLSPDQFAVTFYPVSFGILRDHGKPKHNGNLYIKSFYCDATQDIRGYSDITFERETNAQARSPIKIAVTRLTEKGHYYIRELTIKETEIQNLAVRRQVLKDLQIFPKFIYSGKYDRSHLDLDVLADWIEEAETHLDSGQAESPCDDLKQTRLIVITPKIKEKLIGSKSTQKQKIKKP